MILPLLSPLTAQIIHADKLLESIAAFACFYLMQHCIYVRFCL